VLEFRYFDILFSKLIRIFLKKIIILHNEIPSFDSYPFSIPSIRNLQEINIDKNVTFFVGENGSGKSKLLEALSPARQLSFLKIIHDLASKGNAQFIIATHSPILLGYPNANILSFDDEHISKYEMTDHTRSQKIFYSIGINFWPKYLVKIFNGSISQE
jgi:predicted ATPase